MTDVITEPARTLDVLARADVLVIGSVLSFAFLLYWLLLSKLLPPTGHWLLDALRDDRYYGVLVPLCMPITLVASYLGWFARKIFNHN